MDEHRKNAYRYLLYWAMLDIRQIAWFRIAWWEWCNPLSWRRAVRHVHRAGAIADSLHNLAFFASADFENFNEEWFWSDWESLLGRFPELRPLNHRNRFEQRLADLQQKNSPV